MYIYYDTFCLNTFSRLFISDLDTSQVPHSTRVFAVKILEIKLLVLREDTARATILLAVAYQASRPNASGNEGEHKKDGEGPLPKATTLHFPVASSL